MQIGATPLSPYTSQGQGQELNWKPLDFISPTAHQASIFVLWHYSGLNLLKWFLNLSITHIRNSRREDRVDSTVTRLQATRAWVRFREGTIPPPFKMSAAHLASYSIGFRSSFPGGNEAGVLSYPLISIWHKAESEWSYTSTPPICFHDLTS